MSRENVELVRKAHDALNRGDLDALLAVLGPEFEYRPALEAGLEGRQGVYRGHDGVRDWWRRTFEEDWEYLRTDIHDIDDRGNLLVVTETTTGRGKATGAELAQTITQVVHVSDGKIIASYDYFDRADALEAVGE